MKYGKNKKIVIAVDGLSSSGKSTLSKKISEKFQYKYIDTGSIYRIITLLAIRKNIFNSDLWNIKNFISSISIEEINNLNVILNKKNIKSKIRSIEVTNKVPFISRIPEIRKKLISIQRNMIKKEKNGVIVDGRDIGNCVFPKSELKFFIKGSIDIRSYRRYKDLLNNKTEKNKNISYEEVKKKILFRDEMDINRKISPLKKSINHIEINNNNYSIDVPLNLIYKIIKKKFYETSK
ncbi:(d)CMP kinase [Blattabacterium cuenoti]|uniref:(d)CMP kinase n=1 Tax=Blattabacterium cuenoti TaxID=1653831 RepID=UPI00163BA1B1|nr:(d)CMP kinase [Blattabacterium cuenoti]